MYFIILLKYKVEKGGWWKTKLINITVNLIIHQKHVCYKRRIIISNYLGLYVANSKGIKIMKWREEIYS